MKKAKYQILNTLWLKIIVILTMTLDHIGALLEQYFTDVNPSLALTGDIFRIFGRIAFPLVALLFAEAMRHTHDKEHYISRLGLMTVIVLAFEIGVYYGANIDLVDGNIFITLLCSASFIYFYESKGAKRFLTLLPFAVIILSFITDIYLRSGMVAFYPSYLKAQFSLYGFILCIGFYFTYYFSDQRVTSLTGRNDLENLRKEPYYRSFTNILWIALLTLVTIIFWLISYIDIKADMYNNAVQSYAMLAIIPIFLYNGEKGYQKKFIQYGCYLYYPLHLLILFLAFYLTLGAPSIGW
ncbi:MAG: conjugal transfer protein TraX [Bacilli bacterium]|nr:conjugal transfer protein TraX [Bacilli bacterium]